MLDTSYLEKTFTRITNNVWLNSNINPDTVIVRYINLPILLGLINGEYYFTYRSSFTDQHEKGEFYDSQYSERRDPRARNVIGHLFGNIYAGGDAQVYDQGAAAHSGLPRGRLSVYIGQRGGDCRDAV